MVIIQQQKQRVVPPSIPTLTQQTSSMISSTSSVPELPLSPVPTVAKRNVIPTRLYQMVLNLQLHKIFAHHQCWQRHLLSRQYYILISFPFTIFFLSSNRRKKCDKVILSEEEYLHDGESIIHIQCHLYSNCHTSLADKFYYRYKDP